jgi:hypothetical protein
MPLWQLDKQTCAEDVKVVSVVAQVVPLLTDVRI